MLYKTTFVFVGATRAKYEVHMIYSGWYRYKFGKKTPRFF